MKKLSLLVCLAVALPLHANQKETKAADASKKEVRIFCANFGEVLQKAAPAKDVSSDLEKMGKELQDKNLKLQEKLAKDVKNYENQKKTLNPESLGKKEGELLALQRECEVTAKASKEEMERAMQRETDKLWKQFEESVTQLAQKESYDLVIDVYSGRMVYVSSNVNINDAVIKAMNKNHEVAKAKGKTDTKLASTGKSSAKA